jgi:hypothetical protein
MNDYTKAENEITDAVTKISLKYEVSKSDTIAILTYLIHNIMHIKDGEK